MTLAEARAALQRRLIFGNEEQIRAVRFMEKVSDCLEAYDQCGERHPEFIHWPFGRGRANYTNFRANCDCVASFPDEVRTAAKAMFEEA